MRINGFSTASKLDTSDYVIVDGSTGTRKVAVSDIIYMALESTNLQGIHKSYPRGRSLGSSVSGAQLAAIRDGSFSGLWIGDYWSIGGFDYRIVDFNYWYDHGSTPFRSPHAVIMPDRPLYNARMHSTNSTVNGYSNAEMYSTGLSSAKSTVNSAFPNLVLTHPTEYFSGYSAVDGSITGTLLTNTTIDLPTEPQIVGSDIVGMTGLKKPSKASINAERKQFALFSMWNGVGTSDPFWTRDPGTDYGYAYITSQRYSAFGDAATALGVRPVFAIG